MISTTYGDYVPPTTGKDRGQFKTFIEACPSGQAEAILEQVLLHWLSFTVKARGDCGVYNLPDKPWLDFLVKYRISAINFGINHLKLNAEAQAKAEQAKIERAEQELIQRSNAEKAKIAWAKIEHRYPNNPEEEEYEAELATDKPDRTKPKEHTEELLNPSPEIDDTIPIACGLEPSCNDGRSGLEPQLDEMLAQRPRKTPSVFLGPTPEEGLTYEEWEEKLNRDFYYSFKAAGIEVSDSFLEPSQSPQLP